MSSSNRMYNQCNHVEDEEIKKFNAHSVVNVLGSKKRPITDSELLKCFMTPSDDSRRELNRILASGVENGFIAKSCDKYALPSLGNVYTDSGRRRQPISPFQRFDPKVMSTPQPQASPRKRKFTEPQRRSTRKSIPPDRYSGIAFPYLVIPNPATPSTRKRRKIKFEPKRELSSSPAGPSHRMPMLKREPSPTAESYKFPKASSGSSHPGAVKRELLDERPYERPRKLRKVAKEPLRRSSRLSRPPSRYGYVDLT